MTAKAEVRWGARGRVRPVVQAELALLTLSAIGELVLADAR